VTEQELRLYIDGRRREVADRRRDAAQQTSEWAADGAIYELDRLEGWLNLQRRGRWHSSCRGVVEARWALVQHGREPHHQAAIEAER
jgi:hypothetical protein